MPQERLRKAFAAYLEEQGLKFTSQRQRIFDRAFGSHEHFSAETLFAWLSSDPGPRVSRATVYRTLALLVEGGFMESLDVGKGELVYEHIAGHKHHDHMVCVSCGRIEEFSDAEIERLQIQAALHKGFVMVDHDLRLFGYCRSCVRKGLCPPAVLGQGSEPTVALDAQGSKPFGVRLPGRPRRGSAEAAPAERSTRKKTGAEPTGDQGD